MWAVIAPALTLLSLTAVQPPGEVCADFQPCTGHHLEARCTWTMGGRVGGLLVCVRARPYGEFAHLAESLVCRVYLRSWTWPRGQDEVESLPWESSQGSGVETSKRQRDESPSGAVGPSPAVKNGGGWGKTSQSGVGFRERPVRQKRRRKPCVQTQGDGRECAQLGGAPWLDCSTQAASDLSGPSHSSPP